MGNKPSRIPVYRYPADHGIFNYKINVRRLTEQQITQYFLTPLTKNRYTYSVDQEDGKIKVFSMKPQAFKELFGHLNPRVVDMTAPTALATAYHEHTKDMPIGLIG